MKVLVAVASKYGATWDIAKAIGNVIAESESGATCAVAHVEDVYDLDDYEAVVLGSAVYAGHWMKRAVNFTERFEGELAKRPVWLFSSGPVGKEPRLEDEDAVDVRNIITKTKARGHHVFAGKLDKENLRFSERAIVFAVRAQYGDFRDWDEIRTWAQSIADEIKSKKAD